MRVLWVIVILLSTVGSIGEGWAEDALGMRPLLTIARKDLPTILPSDCHILLDPRLIEEFLDALDGRPPIWNVVYGRGHHDSGLDERLFSLNRERDAKRAGKEALQWKVVFLWSGELSRYDPMTGGFGLATGPTFTPTRWGVIRFKPEEVPSNLIAIPDPSIRDVLRRKLEAGRKVEIEIVMLGRLIPDESLVYDFSHDEAGVGVIMPVVRIERVEYLLVR